MGGRGGSPNPGPQAPAARAEAPSTPSGLQGDILRVYEGLRDRFDNEWVILTELRNQLGGTREDQDSALLQLVKDRRIRLIPEENQQTLTPADRRAALRVSGEEKHLIGIPR